jgi:hypothetical protein
MYRMQWPYLMHALVQVRVILHSTYMPLMHVSEDANACAGFLILWLTFLPFALWGICGWASPLAEAVLAFLLMGVENIGGPLWNSLPCTTMHHWMVLHSIVEELLRPC